MRFLTKIRQFFFQKALSESLSRADSTERKAANFSSAKSIGVLFDATDENNRQAVVERAAELSRQGKKVRLLGFVDLPQKRTPQTLPFVFFDRKTTDWKGRPNNEKAEAFAREKFDLLLVLTAAESRPIEWIAAHSKAKMKAGQQLFFFKNLDLAIEMPENSSFKNLFGSLDFFLKRLVVKLDRAEKLVLEPVL